jgi:hypothetical protein
MSFLAAALVSLVLQAGEDQRGDSAHTVPVVPSDAYLDAEAGRMVRGARDRSESENRLIHGYRVLARDRNSVHLRAFGRNRLAFRQEHVARVEWERDKATRVEMMGSREVAPLVRIGSEAGSDEGLVSAAGDLAFDPDREWVLRVPLGAEDENRDTFVHPLAAGSEAHYRFRSGEPITVRLAGGEDIRLAELQILPRRSDHRLVSGSIWLDVASFAPVRAAFRFSVPVAVGAYGEDRAWGWPGEIRLFLVEYGLWQGRWWLPRLFALEGSTTIGSATLPIRKEVTYEEYEVYADTAAAARLASGSAWDVPEHAGAYEVLIDSLGACGSPEDAREGTCRAVEVWVPRDRSLLLESDLLPDAPFGEDVALLTEEDLRRGAEALYASGVVSDLLPRPEVGWKWIDPSLLHFNRVEGATIGTSATVGLANLGFEAAGWLGIADRSAGFRAALTRSRYSGTASIAGYRRLAAFSPRDRPFQLGNSLSALALGIDHGDYFRTEGVEIAWTPAPEATPFYRWRAYAERQSAVEKHTDFSLRNAVGGDGFRSNPAADRATQFGIDGSLQLTRGLDPAAWRGGVELEGTAEAGTYDFLRSGVRGYVGMPLPGGLAGAVEVAGGGSVGSVPLQRLWYLGGPSTVRGIGPASRVAGTAFWRARGEVGSDVPAARVVAFGDVGWAGARRAVTLDPSLVSVGVGASFLDGLVRLDLARALRGGSGWRLAFYLGGAM